MSTNKENKESNLVKNMYYKTSRSDNGLLSVIKRDLQLKSLEKSQQVSRRPRSKSMNGRNKKSIPDLKSYATPKSARTLKGNDTQSRALSPTYDKQYKRLLDLRSSVTSPRVFGDKKVTGEKKLYKLTDFLTAINSKQTSPGKSYTSKQLRTFVQNGKLVKKVLPTAYNKPILRLELEAIKEEPEDKESSPVRSPLKEINRIPYSSCTSNLYPTNYSPKVNYLSGFKDKKHRAKQDYIVRRIKENRLNNDDEAANSPVGIQNVNLTNAFTNPFKLSLVSCRED